MEHTQKTILLVEDEVMSAKLTTISLEGQGFRVIHAAHALQALEIFDAHSDIDLVLMNIDLGGDMDGIECAKLIHQRRILPLIFVSSHDEDSIIRKAETVTSFGYILKNSGIAVLIAAIHMASRLFEAYQNISRQNEELQNTYEELQSTVEELESANEQLVISEREIEQRDLALQSSEARFRSTLDSMIEGCQILGFDWQYLYVNESAARHARLSRSEFSGKRVIDLFPGIVDQPLYKSLERCMRDRTDDHCEIEFEFPDGHRDWYEFMIRPVPEGLFILSAECTQRKQDEQRMKSIITFKETMMAELQHRVKNSLTVVSGLISLESSEVSDTQARQALKNAQSRIISMATVYEMLYTSSVGVSENVRLDMYLRKVVDAVLGIHTSGALVRSHLSLNPYMLDFKRTVVISLIVNELVINSIKHAFRETPNGEIFLALEENNGRWSLIYHDSGTSTVSTAAGSGGLGFSLVSLLADQIGLSIEIGFERGVRVSMTLPEYDPRVVDNGG